MDLEEAIKELQEKIKALDRHIKNYEKNDCKTNIYLQLVKEKEVIETVLKKFETLTEERDIYKNEYDKITKALNFKEGSLNPPAEVCIERLKKVLENSVPKKKIEDKIEELRGRWDFAGEEVIEILQELLEE